MIDSHCHLTYLDNYSDIIKSCQDNGMISLLTLSTTIENFDTNLKLKIDHNTLIKVGVGIHPEHIDDCSSYEKLIKYINSNYESIDVIGECGLDYFHTIGNIEKQKLLFIEHIKLAKNYNKSIVIHARNNIDINFQSCIFDAMNILNLQNYDGNAVFHCFTGNLSECQNILENGYYIGFTNIITYPKNIELQYTAKWAIKNYPQRILFETDAPYLPPKHRRGSQSTPYDVQYVYDYFKDYISSEQIDLNYHKFLSNH